MTSDARGKATVVNLWKLEHTSFEWSAHHLRVVIKPMQTSEAVVILKNTVIIAELLVSKTDHICSIYPLQRTLFLAHSVVVNVLEAVWSL